MNKNLIKINIALLIIMLVFDVWYMFGGGLFAKTIASMMFVMVGVINFYHCSKNIKNKNNLKFPKWMLVALVFAMIADILIVINFYSGVVLFATAHVFYFISYCKLQNTNFKDLICGVTMSIISLFIIFNIPFIDFGSSLMQIVCSTYAIIISFMVGKAISNLLSEKNNTNKIIVIGSILFFISDFMLMLDVFGNIQVASYLCLGTYYPAQFLLGFSVLIYGNMNISGKIKNIKFFKAS